MINVYRCAGQAATRDWLECYYGAAQPQRSALGLQPVPAAQLALVSAPPAPGRPHDQATRDAVIESAARCGGVADERPWLDCYYAAANPIRSLLGLARVPIPTPAAALAPARSGTGDVSRNRPAMGSVRLASYTFDRNGFFTVVLDNGDVWHQLDGDTTMAHWFKKPALYVATVTPGAFGSFNLTVKGEKRSYKVHRAS
jgi:hypothetical protein